MAVSPVGLGASAGLFAGLSGGEVTVVCACGRWAYAGAHRALLVIDLEDPTRPAVRAAVPLVDHVNGVAFDGSTVHVANGNRGVALIDARDPTNPAPAGWIRCGYSTRVEVRGDLMFSIGQNHTLAVLTASRQVASWRPVPKPKRWLPDFCLHGDYAVVAGYSVSILDVSRPEEPRLIGSAPVQAWKISAAGSLAFASTRETLTLIDLSAPECPEVRGSLALPAQITAMFPFSTSWLLVAGGGLHVVDIAQPTAPRCVASLPLPVQGVAAVGDLVLAACGNQGLVLLDLSSPASPRILATVPAASARDVVSAGRDLVAVAAGNAGMALIGTARPDAPRLLATLPVGDAQGIACSGGRLFLATRDRGLVVAEVANSAEVRETDCCAETRGAYRLCSALPFVYLLLRRPCWRSIDESVLVVVELAPARVLATLPIGTNIADDGACALCMEGARLYVTVRSTTEYDHNYFHYGHLLIIDVTSPAKPRVLGGFSDRPDGLGDSDLGPYNGVAVRDGLAFLACGEGLGIVEVADAAAPRLVSLCRFSDARSVCLVDSLALVATGISGVVTVDVTNPRQPRKIAEAPMADAQTIASVPPYLWVANGGHGLSILRLS